MDWFLVCSDLISGLTSLGFVFEFCCCSGLQEEVVVEVGFELKAQSEGFRVYKLHCQTNNSLLLYFFFLIYDFALPPSFLKSYISIL